MRLTTHLTITTALVVSLAAAPLYAQETDSNTSDTNHRGFGMVTA